MIITFKMSSSSSGSYLATAQAAALKTVPRVTAGLSVLGSAFVLGSVLWTYYQKSRQRQQIGGGYFTNRRTSATFAATMRMNIANTATSTAPSVASPSSIGNATRPLVGRNLLVGLSLMDLLSSMSYVIGSVAYPIEDGGRGNQATCNGEKRK